MNTPDRPGNWQPIATAPAGYEGPIANYLRASEAAKANGSKDLWVYGSGREVFKGNWTNILGAEATHWLAPTAMELEHRQMYEMLGDILDAYDGGRINDFVTKRDGVATGFIDEVVREFLEARS